MKKIILLASLSFGIVMNANAQVATNLIDNGGFEDISGKIKKAGSIDLATGWISPTKTAADLYSSIIKEKYGNPENTNGKEDPHEGKSYAGFSAFSYGDKMPRTYVSTKLKLPMRKGQKYCVKFYVSLSESSKYGVNNIAANFSRKQYNIQEDKTIMGESHIMHVENPVFSAQFGWEEICGTYISEGGEKFLTIGNFSSNGETLNERMKKPSDYRGTQEIRAYYYLDNISVELIDEESDCKCLTDTKEEASLVYAVAPVNPEGMTDAQIFKYTTVYFGYNSKELSLNAEEHLANVVAVMKKDASAKLKLMVHTDSDEAVDKKAVAIEADRADAIKAFLAEEGIAVTRIMVEKMSDTDPLTTSGSDIGNAKNRRVEFELVK